MKKVILLCVIMSLMSGMSVSCTDVENSSSVEESSAITVMDKEYTHLTFKDVPNKVTDTYVSDSRNVQITGYLSDSLSKDGSTGYLWDTGYGTTPSDNDVGTCIVLNMSDIEKSETIVGDQFVLVKGTVIPEAHCDVFNIKSEWYLSVDSIEVLTTLPDNVQQYEDYMASHEWEALAKTIDFIGNAVYLWTEDETAEELDMELFECDIMEVQTKTRELYPELYNSLSEDFMSIIEQYALVSTHIKNKTRPEDVTSLFDNLCKTYENLSESLVSFGCFE